MAGDYLQALDALKAGTQQELVITPDDFAGFRPVWTNYPNRTEIVGTAQIGGTIVYHYQSEKPD